MARLKHEADDPWPAYKPCACPGPCAKDCPCPKSENFCTKFCACDPQLCNQRRTGCSCSSKMRCLTLSCPCRAAGTPNQVLFRPVFPNKLVDKVPVVDSCQIGQAFFSFCLNQYWLMFSLANSKGSQKCAVASGHMLPIVQSSRQVGIPTPCRRLQNFGCTLGTVTNQHELSNGLFSALYC